MVRSSDTILNKDLMIDTPFMVQSYFQLVSQKELASGTSTINDLVTPLRTVMHMDEIQSTYIIKVNFIEYTSISQKVKTLSGETNFYTMNQNKQAAPFTPS